MENRMSSVDFKVPRHPTQIVLPHSRESCILPARRADISVQEVVMEKVSVFRL
jgi:hypothetical protein